MVVATKVPRAFKNNKTTMKRIKKQPIIKVTNTSNNPSVNKIQLIGQEIKIAKILAGNNTKLGEKQLNKLKKWLQIRSNSSFPFNNHDFLRLWKGLFYCMWMADKPLPQEKLANDIASLLLCFDNVDIAIQFYGMFLQTMSKEWFGIDQWRIDKFMMLVRRVTRQMFSIVHSFDWNQQIIEKLNQQLVNNVLKNASAGGGLLMHLTDIYLEEVSKVSEGNVPVSSVTQLIQPFGMFIAKPSNIKHASHIIKNIFNHLLFQSDLGREYKDKFDTWKSFGFPGSSIDDLELVEQDTDQSDDDGEAVLDDNTDDETSEKHLDPRAGRVDVIMHEIPFDPQEIIDVLQELKYKDFTNVRTRNFISRIVNQYSTFASGRFPLGIQRIKLKAENFSLPDIEEKANDFLEFENELYKDSKELKQMNKKKRKRMLKDPEFGNNKINKSDNPMTPNSSKKVKIPHSTQLTPDEKKKINEWQEDDIISEESTDKVKLKKRQNADNSVESASRKKSKLAKSADSVNDDVSTPIRTQKKLKAVTQEVSKNEEEDKTPIKQINLVTNKQRPDTPMPTPNTLAKKQTKSTNGELFKTNDEWTEPLKAGETEYFVPSRKKKLLQINTLLHENTSTPTKTAVDKSSSQFVINPLAVHAKKLSKQSLNLTAPAVAINDSVTSTTSEKRVKIMLKHNRSQDTSEYFRQLRSSPSVPYDSTKKPIKSLLKPNLIPSPINPFYKKKLGLNFD